MDTSASNPPQRIITQSTKKLSTRAAQATLENFLEEFQQRSSPLKGGDNAVTVQLQKLNKALQEERERKRKTEGR